jgi:hypothetical protein
MYVCIFSTILCARLLVMTHINLPQNFVTSLGFVFLKGNLSNFFFFLFLFQILISLPSQKKRNPFYLTKSKWALELTLLA